MYRQPESRHPALVDVRPHGFQIDTGNRRSPEPHQHGRVVIEQSSSADRPCFVRRWSETRVEGYSQKTGDSPMRDPSDDRSPP